MAEKTFQPPENQIGVMYPTPSEINFAITETVGESKTTQKFTGVSELTEDAKGQLRLNINVFDENEQKVGVAYTRYNKNAEGGGKSQFVFAKENGDGAKTYFEFDANADRKKYEHPYFKFSKEVDGKKVEGSLYVTSIALNMLLKSSQPTAPEYIHSGVLVSIDKVAEPSIKEVAAAAGWKMVLFHDNTLAGGAITDPSYFLSKNFEATILEYIGRGKAAPMKLIVDQLVGNDQGGYDYFPRYECLKFARKDVSCFQMHTPFSFLQNPDEQVEAIMTARQTKAAGGEAAKRAAKSKAV